MEINQIMQTVIEFAPAITALIGVLVSLVVGIKKIKNNNSQTYLNIKLNNEAVVKELKDANDKLIEDNQRLKEENAEFKKALRDFLDKAAKEAAEKANPVKIRRKK